MAQSVAQTVADYLAELPPDRRETMAAVRQIILEHLPEGFQEAMQYGMISYVIPLERYPKTYNKQALAVVSLAAQKNYMSLYLMSVYGSIPTQEWFTERYRASGKKLNMGKSCLRFKTLDDLPTELIGEAIARTSVEDFLEIYEAARGLH